MIPEQHRERLNGCDPVLVEKAGKLINALELATVVADLKAWKTAVEAKLNELRYRQDRDDNAFTMLLNALRNREPVQ